jgi:hypothetical protein
LDLATRIVRLPIFTPRPAPGANAKTVEPSNASDYGVFG